jgi:hypothetical protein
MKNQMTKNKLECMHNKICDEAEIYVLKQIEKTCRRFGWSFKTTYGISLYRDGINGDDEIFESRLHQLVYWFEEEFRSFGFYVCDKGEWIEGQTQLIQFEKPKLTLNKVA